MSASIASVYSLVLETRRTMKEDIRTRGKLVIFITLDFLSFKQYVNFTLT